MLTLLDASRGMEVTLLPSKVEGHEEWRLLCSRLRSRVTRNGDYIAPV